MSHLARPRRSLVTAVGTAALLCAVVSACAGSPPATPPGSTASSPVDATSSDGATPSTAEAACTPSDAVTAATKGFAEVTAVKMIGGCGQVSVETSLPPGDPGTPSSTKAVDICTAVSQVAYVGPVYGVTVVGQDGHELAAGVQDHRDCIPG